MLRTAGLSRAAKLHGLQIIYGDAGQAVVLEAAAIEKACLRLVTIPVIVVAHSIVFHARQLKASLEVVARVEGVEEMKSLYEKGVSVDSGSE